MRIVFKPLFRALVPESSEGERLAMPLGAGLAMPVRTGLWSIESRRLLGDGTVLIFGGVGVVSKLC